MSTIYRKLTGVNTDITTINFFVKTFFQDRFLGSSLGLFWAVLSPILMLAIFTFVFGFVFRSKLPGAETSITFVIWLISGYGPWLSISESIMTSTNSILGSAGLIKNLKIKSELLSIAGTLMGVVPLVVAISYLAVLLIISGNSPSVYWLVLPLIIAIQFVFVAGVGLFFSALAVFWRDLTHMLPNALMMVMFSTPIFYPITAFPKLLQNVTLFNPIYLISEWYRQPLIYDAFPPTWTLLYLIFSATTSYYCGLYFFKRVSPYFESRL
ncbi:MAG: ABC transporter permease [Gammaproteobacteria bacterium]|uniref:ABC transporter permease n=1 Tax=Fulvivirga sp. TaxID=1931237 RepID=UPI0032EF40E4